MRCFKARGYYGTQRNTGNNYKFYLKFNIMIDINIKTCVCSITYNHSKYITDTMNGFVMQETDYPFVCCIIDDASTDGEQQIISEFINRHFTIDKHLASYHNETDKATTILAQHKTNKNCYFYAILLKENHYSKGLPKKQYIQEWIDKATYISLCEGDDCWTDPSKLKQQTDFLDSHPNYSMCFHDVDIVAEKGRTKYDVFGKLEDRDYTIEETIRYWKVPTCSMVLRKDVWNNIPTNSKFRMGDNVVVYTSLTYGQIRCIPKKMGAYRLTPTSWIGGQSSKKQRYLYISHYKGLIESLPICRCQAMYENMESQYFQLMTILKMEGDTEEFNRIKDEYLNYPGECHIARFNNYYRREIARTFAKKLLGKNLSQIIARLKKS